MMLNLRKSFIASSLAIAVFATAPAPAWADGHMEKMASAEGEKAEFEAERAIILSMAGNHAVTFDMKETTAWMEGYKPVESKISGGYESVRVAEDTGTKIVLQHLLVVDINGTPYVVKHWRQDWEYEPETLLTFSGGDSWELTVVTPEMRKGAWSQTVYQVDDSPRYAGIGIWDEVDGIQTWTSNKTTRPLARRDAIREPIYDRYFGINRHQIGPKGWIHWQDNLKMMTAEGGSGELIPVVQESVLNTYLRYDGYNVAAADSYWEKTRDYWAAIRDKWDAVAEANGGIKIAQQADVGTTIAGELLQMADAIKNGETDAQSASEKAVALINEGTARKGG
ncbi:MAG: DUF6607 family protein [Pseudomonadota bacterium]